MTDVRPGLDISTSDRRDALDLISAAIRNVREADQLVYEVAAIVGTAIGASRVGYSRFDSDQDTMITGRDWTAPAVLSLAGRIPLSAYGSYIKEMRAGVVVSVTDVYTDPRTGNAAALDELHARAFLNVSILENRILVAVLFVNMPVVHDWTEAEITFLSEVADRLRVGAERLRIEAEREALVVELRALNATLEQRVEERSASLRLYQNIVQSDAAPIVAFDRHLRLIAFNQAHADAVRRLYGIDQQVGDRLVDQIPPEQARILKESMGRALAGESFILREGFGDPAYGTSSWEVSYNPLLDETGSTIGAFHHAVDITVEVQAGKALAEAQEALRQSQKLEAIGQLTGGVAHDFNNLLTIIRGSVELLQRPGLADAKRARYIDAIAETTDRAAKLTGQLLSFARRQALTPELTDIGAAVKDVVAMVRTLTGSRVSIDLQLPKQPCIAKVDRSQFETAIVNMAINARDAMNGEGRLAIAVGPVSGVPGIRAHSAIAGDFVAVTITDDGAGIASADLVRIFEPFFTTKEVGKGTGLGLSQTIGFAKQSGGDVGVESIVGKGTTFSIYLPRIEAEIAADTSVDEAPLKDGDGFHVLLVEDNPDVGRFAKGALEELGYESVHAEDAEQALVELGRDHGRFDVVFCDVVMPGMNGVEFGTLIRERYPTLPVILTSGYSHVLAENGQHGFELLHKPYSIEQLSRVLRKAIAWRLRQLKRG